MARVTETWQVRPILWGLIISEPGLRKSPLIEFLTGLLNPIQANETQRWEASVAEAEAEKARIDEAWRTFRREQRLAERQDRPDPACSFEPWQQRFGCDHRARWSRECVEPITFPRNRLRRLMTPTALNQR